MVRWTFRAGDCRRASLPTTPFLMLFRFLLSVSIVASALAPAAVEAKSSCGVASYYGRSDGFHGRLTASGERFNADALTFAHRSLPFGTKIKVVNQDNGRSVIVRGNDRGPFTPGRIVDLSEAAFSKIASKSQGLARICFSKL
jgi:rare lipoprotein A